MKNLKEKLLKNQFHTIADLQKAGKMMCPIRMSMVLSRQCPEFDKWCKNNLENDYILFSDAIYTKTEEDAVAFKLRWL